MTVAGQARAGSRGIATEKWYLTLRYIHLDSSAYAMAISSNRPKHSPFWLQRSIHSTIMFLPTIVSVSLLSPLRSHSVANATVQPPFNSTSLYAPAQCFWLALLALRPQSEGSRLCHTLLRYQETSSWTGSCNQQPRKPLSLVSQRRLRGYRICHLSSTRTTWSILPKKKRRSFCAWLPDLNLSEHLPRAIRNWSRRLRTSATIERACAPVLTTSDGVCFQCSRGCGRHCCETLRIAHYDDDAGRNLAVTTVETGTYGELAVLHSVTVCQKSEDRTTQVG
jgi:hypothetical protein